MARGGNKPSTTPKGASNTGKKPTAQTKAASPNSAVENLVSFDLQQKCLDIFRDALNPTGDDSVTLQEVKGHLYNRDFATAFGKEEYLRVYASRWSPSRALAYLKVFLEVAPRLGLDGVGDGVLAENGPLRAVCLGGGAGGELVGLGAFLSTLAGERSTAESGAARLDLVDKADWSAVTRNLAVGLMTPPALSKYASQAKKDANRALVPEQILDVKFHQLDALSPEAEQQTDLSTLLDSADLATFMFTLNELYSTSLPKTQTLLTHVTSAMKTGAHLLVVDSPGSYSTVSLNGTEKKYPMQWLLDHTLLGARTENKAEGGRWQKVVEEPSCWFRLSKELRYPISLEDMRYQMHLYKRVGT